MMDPGACRLQSSWQIGWTSLPPDSANIIGAKKVQLALV